MGCRPSVPKDGSTNVERANAGQAKSDQKQLLDSYVLGDVIGQGAFGIVYACAAKGSQDFCYAVKMVDKVDSPLDDIKREAVMLKELEHPNVVKFHDMYYEKCFVCIVMDRYTGGDLIEGMQLHWKHRGKIPCNRVLHVVRQMAATIHHLHTKSVVHRDVKGDNFLTDRPDILDEQCKIIMSDFGTATTLNSPFERLKTSCGTKIYWAPEFFNLDYGLKVDIWALGVIFYGLIEGRFPFKGETDVRQKVVKLQTNVPRLCQEFLMKLLERDEGIRLASGQVVSHGWINASTPKDTKSFTPGDDEHKNFSPEGIREGGVNAAVEERRKELIERLENQKEKRARPKGGLGVLWSPKFEVADKRKAKTVRYEWWPAKKAQALIGEGSVTCSTDSLGDKVDVGMVDKMLREHGIDSSKFGVGGARTLEQFANEVRIGSALLMLDASSHKKLVRVVDVVLLRVVSGGKFLVEQSETFADGRGRDNLNRLPGTKREPHENKRTCAARIASTMLNLGGSQLSYDFTKQEVFEEEEESRSYPGVLTVYRKAIIPCRASPEKCNAGSYSHTDARNNTKTFKWLNDAECTAANIKLRAPLVGDEVSALVMAPVGFSEDELRQYLIENKVDPEIYGKGPAKTLAELSAELTKGESSLMVQKDGVVVRIVDVVVLHITKAGVAEVLVEAQEKLADGTINRLERLPGAKRRPDEHMFTAAQTLLRRQLQMDENCVTIDNTNTKLVEMEKDSLAYPGMKTIYRKRIISAELYKPSDS
eukprot:TRINITY_DN17867_c0_g4_i1.p1 TRINITY_DN17867_c0_g4~~TRINITY_DN17867_c0_g4_i1.p1  ORF type:complete len:778 (-),score=158.85 TRINITY_DN17867_c0_g4_i1:186-2474(-)